MEPRIATLLDQSPYKRLTLDPSVLTTSSGPAHRYIEPAPSRDEVSVNHEPQGHHARTSSQAHSSAPIARVLNDPGSSPHAFHTTSGRHTSQNAVFPVRTDVSGSGPITISPDARRRDEHHHAYGGENPLIQLPKPPQAPRRTAKRPRIPPLLQGLHQPPPLPPKSRLFPPITSDRSSLVNDVGDRFNIGGGAFRTSSSEELAKAKVSPQKVHRTENDVIEQATRENAIRKEAEISTAAEPAADPPPVTRLTKRAQSQAKAPRKRTRWSQKETDDLLIGVGRFGIGSWKKILECPDFQFQGRTAVDLKDRFRVCRPGEGLKARKVTASGATEVTGASKPGERSSRHDKRISEEKAADSTSLSVQRETPDAVDSQDTTSQAAISNTDGHVPFPKSKRRARREFTDIDDKNLLNGFKRHDAKWHKIRDDFELGFGMRHPTDLRDRFRIRYPELFAEAGFKLKPKEERALQDRANEVKAQEEQVASRTITNAGKTLDKGDKSVTPVIVTTTPNIPSVSTLVPVTTTSQTDSVRPTFDLITDLTFSDDEDDRSPVVLNRNILQWADENSSSAPATTAASTTTTLGTSNPSNDLLYNPFTASDGIHINPLATLKLPFTAHWSYMNPPTTAPLPSLPPPGPLKHSLPATSTGTSTSTSRAQQDMRTPNLPNIVFPYVPNASARNAVHNLPAPADILSSGQGSSSDNYIWIG